MEELCFQATYWASTADILYLVVSLVLFGGAIYLLVRLQRQHVKFGYRVIGGLALGIALGTFFQPY